LVKQPLNAEVVMGGGIFENVVERTHLDGIVIGDGSLVWAALLGGQADVGAGLP
jgi:hypothetical protein